MRTACRTEWETTYGLDPFDATGDDGASGDPDGDGRTNAQELADGTHPRGVLTRYFAEGATGPFFRTRIDLANPNAGRAASVLVRFLTDTGARIAHNVVVPPAAHEGIDPSTIPGLAHTTFSSVIEADQPIGVERTMTWDPSGYGSHVETGVVAPATTWYLAEGATSGPFALFYLLQNPQATPVAATVRYLRPFGLPPIEKTYTLPPFSRTTIVVDAEGAELASTDVSAVITAASPIVVERAMYYSQPQQPFAAGHESAGVTAPALEWFLAEGAAGDVLRSLRADRQPEPIAGGRRGRVPARRRRRADEDLHRRRQLALDDLGRRRGAAGRARASSRSPARRCRWSCARRTACRSSSNARCGGRARR